MKLAEKLKQTTNETRDTIFLKLKSLITDELHTAAGFGKSKIKFSSEHLEDQQLKSSLKTYFEQEGFQVSFSQEPPDDTNWFVMTSMKPNSYKYVINLSW